MYEVPESEEYRRQWLKAERDLALMGIETQPASFDPEPLDIDETTEHTNKSSLPNHGDYLYHDVPLDTLRS